MPHPILILLSIAAFSAIFILLPIVLTTLSDYRRPRGLRCPETGGPASVTFDPGRAARGAIFGRVSLRVADCSLWPEKAGCDGACARAAAEDTQAG